MPLIRNKQTGQTMFVEDGQLGQYGLSQQAEQQQQVPQDPSIGQQPEGMTNDQPQYITGRSLQEHQQALNAARAAGDKTAEADINANFEREYKYQQDYIEKAKDEKKLSEEPSAAEKKANKEKDVVTALIEAQLKNYSDIGGSQTGPVLGRLSKIKAGFGIGGEKASAYERSRLGLAASTKQATGDTGILTDPDREYLASLMPKATDSKEQAAQQVKALDSFVKAKYGSGFSSDILNKFGVEKSSGKRDGSGNPIIDFLLGGAINVANDIGTGINANTTEKTRNRVNAQADQQAQQLEQQGMNTQDPQERIALLKRANQIRESVSKGAGELSSNFSADINKNYVSRSLKAGSEITTVAALPSLFKSVLNLPKTFKGATGSLSKSTLAEGRDIAAKASKETVSTDKLIKTGENYISNDPTAARLWTDVLKPALVKKEKMTIPQLLEQLKVWNDAYTSAGKVGKTSLAGLNDALARSGKDIIKDVAPEVAAYTAKLARAYKVSSLLNKSVVPTAVGAAVGVPISIALYKLLGMKR